MAKLITQLSPFMMLDVVGRQIQIFDTGRMTEWMTPDELSALTGLSKGRLANLRAEKRRYPFYRFQGSRTPLYKRDEIDAIIEASRIDVRP